MFRSSPRVLLLGALLVGSPLAQAGLGGLLDKALTDDNKALVEKALGSDSTSSTGTKQLDNATLIDGLKESLKVGSQRAIEQVSAQGGYLNDAEIRIPMPSPLDKLGSVLRKSGYGDQVDSFETTMNRAAEQAAPEAASILADTIGAMSFSDAQAIYSGGEHAATDYLREKSGDRIAQLFRPVVDETLNSTEATRYYQVVATQAAQLPIVGQQVNTDLGDYVTSAALDGLFTKLAEQEAAIRKDPVAQTTKLLKTLWGN